MSSMRVIIGNREQNLTYTGKFGREAEIYSIENLPNKLAKIYEEEKRNSYIQRKVTALINKFRSLNLGGVENYIGYPETPVYQKVENKREFCGFIMQNFSSHIDFLDNGYDINKNSYKSYGVDEKKADNIVLTLFAYLETLHRAGIILGDINADNILLETNSLMPVIVDIDSSQIGTFYGNTAHKSYIDPTVQIDGYGRNKHFVYSTNSDIFALAVVCYEFIVGVHPYYFTTDPPTNSEFKKSLGLSFIDYIEENGSKIEKHKIKTDPKNSSEEFIIYAYEDNEYKAIQNRLHFIKENNSSLYSFFRSIFMSGNRDYYRSNLSPRINVTSRQHTDANEMFFLDLIPQSKEDPKELDLFFEQFDLDLF